MDEAGWLKAVEAAMAAGGAAEEHLADLYLAWAAANGDPAAVRRVDGEYLARIDAVVRNIDPSDTFLDEVRQELRVTLLVGEPGRPPRIGGYQGRGPLLAWVRVAAARAALGFKRARRDPGRVNDEEVIADLVAREPDPELHHLATTYRAEFAQALRDALAALPERARVVLRLHYVEGLTLARIGELYGVHESTVSRWLKQAGEAAAEGAERRARDRLALSPQTFESLARLLRDGLEVSISGLLGRAR